MKKSYWYAGILALAVIAWIGSGQLPGQDPAAKATDDGAAGEAKAETIAPLYKVRVQTLAADSVAEEIHLLGRTEAKRKVTLRAETAGSISEVIAKKGQVVEKGDVIVRIAEDDRRLKLREAEALVQQREMEYEAAADLAKKNFRSKTKLAEARTLLDGARAALTVIKLDLSHTEIIAPFDGVVDSRAVEVGDYLKVGDNIATVIDLSTVVVTGDVAESLVSKIETGSKGRAVLVDGRELEGEVTFVAKASATTTRTFRVEMEAPNPDHKVAEGITADIRLAVGEKMAHKLSPAVLTLNDKGIVGVKVVNAEDMVEFLPVSLVSDTPEGTWLGGLPSEIRLITVGQEFVKAGQKVQAVEE